MAAKSWQQLNEDVATLNDLMGKVFARLDRTDFDSDENLRRIITETEKFASAFADFESDLSDSAPALRQRGYHTRVDKLESAAAKLSQQLTAVQALADQAEREMA